MYKIMKFIFIILIVIFGITGCGEKVDILKSEEVEVSSQSSDTYENEVEAEAVELENATETNLDHNLKFIVNFGTKRIYSLGVFKNGEWISSDSIPVLDEYKVIKYPESDFLSEGEEFNMFNKEGFLGNSCVENIELFLHKALLQQYFVLI